MHALLGLYTLYYSCRNQPDEVMSVLAWNANTKQFEIHWAPAAHRATLHHSRWGCYCCIQLEPDASDANFKTGVPTEWDVHHPDMAAESNDVAAAGLMPFGAPKGAHVHQVGM